MLSALSVRNIVLIDQLELSLAAGLTVLTGETGAGKSILLDSLTLALGGRGDASLVRAGQESGQVVAVLSLAATHPARQFLRDNDIADDDELILRRVQFADGRTKAFVNDQPISAALLKQIGGLVVEIHGQHDDRAFADVATHRAALDAFGGHETLQRRVAEAARVLSDAEARVAAQERLIAEAQAREDYARHVVGELGAIKPRAGEEDELAERRQTLMVLEKASEDVREADDFMNGAAAPGPQLAGLMRRLMRKADAGATVFQPLIDAIDAALVALDGTSDALEALKRDMSFDPRELESVEERLFALRGLARKHQTTCDGLVEVLQRYTAELDALESGEESLKGLAAERDRARAAYLAVATDLTRARLAAASALEAAVAAELPDLKLGSARFSVDLQTDRARVSADGQDQVSFNVATNPGTPAGPLFKVASGGELSRFLLALKVVLADRGSAPVLVFDEIDTGVGGAVADAIGRRLRRLADRVQVLAVTHAPQVAARAGQHLFIEKQAVNAGAHMRTHVRPLDDGARQEEVARMLAGASVTDEARAAAGRLISEVS